jgi:hypothetical protein
MGAVSALPRLRLCPLALQLRDPTTRCRWRS